MSDAKATVTVDPFAATSLAANDAKLVEKKDAFGALITKYSAVPSADVIARTVKSLQDRKFIVHRTSCHMSHPSIAPAYPSLLHARSSIRCCICSSLTIDHYLYNNN